MSLTKAQIARVARLLGSKGGRATASRLTPEERSASAARASDARWARVWDEQAELKRVNEMNAAFWASRRGVPNE
jgi:hypothetical protein